MARQGQTSIEFNPRYFDSIMKTAGVSRLAESAAKRALAIAQSTAPWDSGDYSRGLQVQRRDSKYRPVYRVVGTDPKTLLVESKTGNLARALRAAKEK